MTSKESAFFWPLDFFSQPHFYHDSVLLSKARALVGTNLFFAILLSVCVMFVYTTDSLGDQVNLFVWWLMLPAIVLNLLMPLMLRQFGCLTLCQHTTLLITFAAIVIGICTSGGPVLAPNNQLMVMQAALSLFLLGIRGGLIWSGIVLATQLLLYALYLTGTDFPNIQPPEAATAGAIFNWALAFCSIICLILLIELSRGQLEAQRHQEQEKFRYMATHDGLTALANRRLFEERLNHAIEHSQQHDGKVLLLYLDLDKFKPINDEWGHDTGDNVLKVVAARMKAAIRDKDTVARLGGDEFAILLPSLDHSVSTAKLTESIYQRVTQPIHIKGKFFDIDCSIGVCCYPQDATSADELWQLADDAMYKAKKSEARWHAHQQVRAVS